MRKRIVTYIIMISSCILSMNAISTPVKSILAGRSCILEESKETPLPPLPEGVVAVEYIESHGPTHNNNQYINTGVIPNVDMPFDVVFMNNGPANSAGYGNVFGSRQSSNNNEYQLSLYYNGTCSLGYRNQRLGMYTNIKYRVVYDGNSTLKINNDVKQIQKGNISNSYPIFLFGINERNIPFQLQSGRIYYCKFGDEREFIPVRIGSGEEVVGAMYDLVSGQLFCNAGSGKFLIGPDRR